MKNVGFQEKIYGLILLKDFYWKGFGSKYHKYLGFKEEFMAFKEELRVIYSLKYRILFAM